MTFKESIASDLANVFLNDDEFADEIIYTPSGASPSTIKVVIQYGQEDNPGRGTVSSVADVLVSKADISNPQYGDKITIGSDIWSVITVLAKDSCVSQISIRKDKSERPIYR